MNLHELEERDLGRGPLLWDADPDVCCAAFQLGACRHTEYFDEERDLDDIGYDDEFVAIMEPCPICDDPRHCTDECPNGDGIEEPF